MSEFLVLAHWSADSQFGFMSSPLFDGDKPRVFNTAEHATLYAEHMNATRGTSQVYYASAPRQLFEQRIGPIPEIHDSTAVPFSRPRGQVTQDDYETRVLLLGWRPSDITGLWTRNPADKGMLAPLRTPDEIWSDLAVASLESFNEIAMALANKMTYATAARELTVGDVVISTQDIDSYPHYYIEAGARFVVTLNGLKEGSPLLSLRLVPQDSAAMKAGNLKEWGNCVEFYGPTWEGIEHDPGVHDDEKDHPGHAWNKTGIPIRKDNEALEFAGRLAAVYTYRLAKQLGSTIMETIVALNNQRPPEEDCASEKFAVTASIIDEVYQELREDRPAAIDPELLQTVRSLARSEYFPAYAASEDEEEEASTDPAGQSLSEVASNPLAEPLLELLQYIGGWDLTEEENPIVKARKAYEAATGSKL